MVYNIVMAEEVTLPNSQTPQDPVTPQVPATPTEPTVPSTSSEPTTPEAPTAPPVAAQPDMEAVKKDLESSITEKVSKGVVEKIAEALGITKKEEVEKIPQTKEELMQFVKDNARQTYDETQTEQQKQEQETQRQQDQQLQEGAKRFQTLWAGQYNELAERNLVPKITKAEDKNDPGNVAKVKILTKLKQMIDENQKKGVDYVPTLKEVFYENPNVLRTETTTGANAPISGGGRSTANGNMRSVGQLRETSFEDLVSEQYN